MNDNMLMHMYHIEEFYVEKIGAHMYHIEEFYVEKIGALAIGVSTLILNSRWKKRLTIN